ncbi:MAG: hypothetical protein IV107_07070 [Paucibacter sp.]|nr:hypothetical protein [Roseateles sp.]
MNPAHRRLLVIIALLASAALAWLPQLDALATERVDAGLKRALITFATARSLNAVISTLQETTLSFQPLGVGLTIAPGQALDPVNDLIEQFSTLMLGASVSFGVQKVLISVGGNAWVSGALTLAALVLSWAMWRRLALPRAAGMVLAGLLILRFAVPLTILGSDLAFRQLLADDYRASQQGIANTAGELGRQAASAAQAGAPANESTLDRLKRAATLPDLRAYAERMQQAADKAVSDLVRLIVSFLMQTLVFPLLLMWLMLRLARLAIAQR